MGLLGTEVYGGVKIAIWELSETVQELERILGNASLASDVMGVVSSEKRRKERLAAHILLRQVSGGDYFIDHDAAGRPFVPGLGMSLSVSHCPECVAIAVSGSRVGVDVEIVGARQLGVMERFLSVVEMDYLRDTAERVLYASLLWSAKEAVYKLVCEAGLSYVRDIFVPGFVLKGSGEIPACCHTKDGIKDIMLLYRFFPGFVFVVATFKV